MEKNQYIKWKWCICSVLFVFQLLSLTPLLPSPCFEARTLCCAHKLVPTYSVRAFRFIFKLAICSFYKLALCFSSQFAVHQRGRRASSAGPKSGESKQIGWIPRAFIVKKNVWTFFSIPALENDVGIAEKALFGTWKTWYLGERVGFPKRLLVRKLYEHFKQFPLWKTNVRSLEKSLSAPTKS